MRMTMMSKKLVGALLVLVFVVAGVTAFAVEEENDGTVEETCCLFLDSHGHWMYKCHGCLPPGEDGTDCWGTSTGDTCCIWPGGEVVCEQPN